MKASQFSRKRTQGSQRTGSVFLCDLHLILTALLLAPFAALPAACLPTESNWYNHSFFLLQLDHHTTDKMEVGRVADPVETARLLNLVKPEVIQIHAKGTPGWTT